jgi:hypothetical protein
MRWTAIEVAKASPKIADRKWHVGCTLLQMPFSIDLWSKCAVRQQHQRLEHFGGLPSQNVIWLNLRVPANSLSQTWIRDLAYAWPLSLRPGIVLHGKAVTFGAIAYRHGLATFQTRKDMNINHKMGNRACLWIGAKLGHGRWRLV